MGWFRNRGNRGTEEALRALRSEPRPEFASELTERVLAQRPVRRRAWSRAAFASAMAVFMLGTFASFGALSYAASGASNAASVVKRVVVTHKVVVRKVSAAQDQYSQPKVVTEVKQKESAGGVAGAQTPPSTSSVGSAGSLPFTGTGLLGTVIAGMALIALGVLLRRREQRA